MIRIATRRSPLALIQAKEVMDRLPGMTYELIEIDSFGDKNKELSLLEGAPDDIFTRELDEALLEGRADVAVHSAKDLPYPLPEGLLLAALTDCLDSRDALVSRDGVTLSALPDGAKIGVSSAARRSQIAALRPDLAFVSIRGTIAERLAKIDAGEVDAAVVAACALKRLGWDGRIAEYLPFEAHPLQGRLAVTVKRGYPEALKLFAPMDNRRKLGQVFLIGAGPGSADLITVRAKKILSMCDAVVHDDLLDQALLDDLPAARYYAGKRSGNHAMEQAEINALLFRLASEGKNVARLKGGDPFVFGRGGEELRYLAERLIRVQIVPGVTSAFAAASDGEVPLTERGVSSGFALYTAHGMKDGALPVRPDTDVYYMGSSRYAEIAAALRNDGLAEDKPVLVTRNAGLPDSAAERLTLGTLKECTLASPVVITVGAVASSYRTPSSVLYTGLEITHVHREVPARLVHVPFIAVKPRENLPPWEEVRAEAVFFASRSAARFFIARYPDFRADPIAMGADTARVIEAFGRSVKHISPFPESGAAAEWLGGLPYRSVLYPCSSLSDNAVHLLQRVRTLELYDTVPTRNPKPELAGFDGVFFSSASTVRAFFGHYGNFPPHLAAWAQGKHTASEIIKNGVDDGRIIDVSALP